MVESNVHGVDGTSPAQPGPGHHAVEDAVLWDVVEEHLDEAEFLFEQFERALDSPILTLKQLAVGVEARLLAHLDGLRVGGAPVYERLLEPVLSEPDPGQPARLTAAAMVAIEGGHLDGLWPSLGHEDAVVRAAVVRACGLVGGKRLEQWVVDRLQAGITPEQRASLLGIVGRRGLEPPVLIEWLQGESGIVAKAAAEAARRADPQRHMAVMESLLDHADEGVREAAVVMTWMWGSQRAPVFCERWALDEETPRPLAMALYAAMGGPAQHERLSRHLARESHRKGALFALGFSGDVGQLPRLLEHVDSEDPVVAKLAAQAISAITGLNLQDDAFVAKVPAPPRAERQSPEQDPEAARALPPIEEDDLDADLVPAPEEALPVPNPVAIQRYCEQALAKMPAGKRYLGGHAFGADVMVNYLEHAPLRCRHVARLVLSIRTGETETIDTRAFSGEQRNRIGALRLLDWRKVAPHLAR